MADVWGGVDRCSWRLAASRGRRSAAELGAQKVRVNCVIPGAVMTEINERAGLGSPEDVTTRMTALASLHALGRIGQPMEVAEAIVFLLQSKWTTGALLAVDGGLGLGLTPL